MTTVPQAGSWNVHAAISTRWTDAGLDAKFRAEWATPTDTDHQPLNDTEARPSTPVPYCCFEVEQPVTLGHSTGIGSSATERKHVRVGVVFSVFAKRKEATGESGKSVAARMLQQVCAAFDPVAGHWPIPDGCGDYLQRIERVADWLVRGDQNAYEASVRYELFIDQIIARRP